MSKTVGQLLQEAQTPSEILKLARPVIRAVALVEKTFGRDINMDSFNDNISNAIWRILTDMKTNKARESAHKKLRHSGIDWICDSWEEWSEGTEFDPEKDNEEQTELNDLEKGRVYE